MQALPTSSSIYASSVFPWREDTRCKLLVDSDTFLPAMRGAIEAARHYILLEMYLVESGQVTTQIIDALLAAANRHVAIRIIFDGFGTRQLSSADRLKLTHQSIEIVYFHPFSLLRLPRNLIRDHRKLLITDGQTGFTGGVGFSDGIPTKDGNDSAWHDIVVQFKGEVVSDWQHVFIKQWQYITHIELTLPTTNPGANGHCPTRLVSSQPARVNPIYGHLRQRAALARQRLWIATAYFLPSWRLRRVIRQAATRGVDVRLLLPGPITDNPAVRYASQRFYLGLLKAGIKIYEYQPTFMHAKTTLIDDWASVGSSNFDRWSMSRNLEANLEISDKEFSTELEQMFLRDFSDSEEIILDAWTQRSTGQRWKEKIWGAIEHWLDKHK